ncbi:sulfur carrier protein ThiS [Arcobacter peruensis]|uniref:sulfur carrier protein ThiS n=1 Tax=Arcobacter peruensis TaxID=2320140 RepID=UPI000F07C473|nr:sulfur carrier protein ThiS [Arcobacter peruensis]
MIEIIVNGEKQKVKEDININEMIEVLEYKDKSFAVALNGTFVALKNYNETKINDADKIEILAPMVGG